MATRFCFYMAGGKGERFWPLSSAASPKHLRKLFDGKSLIELSVERVSELVEPANIKIVTSLAQSELMANVLQGFDKQSIIVEPEGRDTAPAVALAARIAQLEDPEGVIAMLPADHFIEDKTAFTQTINRAFDIAESTNNLVTVAIPPTSPSTAYGYLKQGEALGGDLHKVDAFVEKPNAATAQEYVDSQQYSWNAGIFVWSVKSIVEAFQKHCPEVWNALANVDVRETFVLAEVYPTIKKISIDYALMEKADNIVMLPASFDWNDVGAWDAYADVKAKDAAGNVQEGKVAQLECSNSLLLNTQKNHRVVGFGLEDMIVVHSENETLIAPKSKAAELKKLLKSID